MKKSFSQCILEWQCYLFIHDIQLSKIWLCLLIVFLNVYFSGLYVYTLSSIWHHFTLKISKTIRKQSHITVPALNPELDVIYLFALHDIWHDDYFIKTIWFYFHPVSMKCNNFWNTIGNNKIVVISLLLFNF